MSQQPPYINPYPHPEPEDEPRRTPGQPPAGQYPPPGQYGGQQGYPPPQGQYAPSQQGYPPPQGQYGGQQGYPPAQGQYQGQQGYPPQQGQYGQHPGQQGYSPQAGYGGQYPPPMPERFVGEWRRSMATVGFWWRALFTLGLYVLVLWPKNLISVSTRRVSQRRGGVLGGSETTIAIENITDVTIDIPPLGALFDYGNVIVQSAGSSAAEIEFRGLGRAKLLREVIFDLRDGKPDEAALKVINQG